MNWVLLLMAMLLTSQHGVVAQGDDEGIFIPIGAGYTDTFDGLLERVIAASNDDAINILVMGVTFSYDAQVIDEEERALNTEDAERRRSQIEDYCNDLISEGQTCNVTLAPFYIRDDVLAEEALNYFAGGLDMIYFLGGDQVIAMEILADTPVERALQEAHADGTIIAGTSAGNALQSVTMIAGYNGDFGPETGLYADAVSVWQTAEQRGLAFGLDNIILEQHFYERTRLGRTLNALAQPDTPNIAVGVDAYAAVTITGRDVVGDGFGLYGAAVLDADTLNAAAEAKFDAGILNMQNVLVHLLAPGDATYTISTRSHSLAPVLTLESVERDYSALSIPEGAGTLMLAGDLDFYFAESMVWLDFIAQSGNDEAKLLVISSGGAGYTDSLTVETTTDPTEDGITGIVLYGADKAAMDITAFDAARDLWLSGVPVLADHAAAAALGAQYAAHGPTPDPTDDDPYADEDAVQGAFLTGMTDVVDGLGWINANIETTLLIDRRLGRFFSLAYTNPQTLALGLPEDTALVITADGAQVIGRNGLFVLDFSQATLGAGDNGGFVVANGLLDVFAPGEMVGVR